MKKSTNVSAQKSQVKVLKYKELILESKEEQDIQEVEFEVEASKQQLESDILATKKSLASRGRDLLMAKRRRPFDSQSVIDVQVSIEQLEDGLSRLEKLKEELF
jgi:hypothetical protein